MLTDKEFINTPRMLKIKFIKNEQNITIKKLTKIMNCKL